MKNFSDITQHLKESVKTDAKKEITLLKKMKKTDAQIISSISKKYKGKLSSIDILSLMETHTRIPVTGNVKHIDEMLSSDESVGEYILVLDENAKDRFYVEGVLNFEFINILEKCDELEEEKYCKACDSTEHKTEECDSLKEMLKTHASKVIKYCKTVRNTIDPLFENKDVLMFIEALNEAKRSRNEKYVTFRNKKYNIKEQTNLFKEQFENGSDKKIIGYCSGRLYEVFDNEYPKNCEYVNLNSFYKDQ